MFDIIFPTKFYTMRFLYILALSATLLFSMQVQAQISFDSPSTVYQQDFNSLPTSGTTNAFNLTGWSANRAEIRAGNGSSNAGAFYSFGEEESIERALGSLTSNAQNFIVFGFELRNNTGEGITKVNLSFTGELWRLGNRNVADVPVADTLYFDYSTTATSIDDSNATWTLVPALFFVSPDTVGDGTAVNGNNPANQSAVTGSIEAAVPSGSGIWLRWNNTRFAGEVLGAKDGLAIDDLTVSIDTGFVEPPVCEKPVSQEEAAQNLTLSTSNDTLFVSFAAGTEAVSGYLVVVSTGTPANPVDGTVYQSGDDIGSSKVISVGAGTSAFFAPLTAGTYTVRVYAYNVCDEILYGVFESASVTYNPSTFVRNEELAPGFSIFPNPAQKGLLNVRFGEQVAGTAEWQLFNLAGAQVAAWRTAINSQMQLSLPSLPTGQYLLMLHQDGKYRTEKLIISE
jgi:hypothetical protein